MSGRDLDQRLATALNRVVPPDIHRVARRVYRSVRPRQAPPERAVVLPADVSDPAGLREYLRDTDIFGPAGHEADDYLLDGFERFRITMAILPDLAPGSRVLELGANPYFITRLLLRRGLDVTCANWFGETSGFERKSRQVVTSPRSGERQVFEFDHFNVETERFPYEDGSFDLVLCCEILEHLPNDPTHLLAEIHRVTRKPGGTLVLTTPNAVRYDSLRRMQRGENIYEELSGYGTYGRHNREYTVEELHSFLGDLGYVVHEAFALDSHPRAFPSQPFPPEIEAAHRGDNLFVTAEPQGEPRWKYPRWLYTSQHAIRRFVRPDVAMGFNDDLQARGFHQLEPVAGQDIRWMGAAPESMVMVDADPAFRDPHLRIEGLSGPAAFGQPISVRVSCGGDETSVEVPSDGTAFDLRLPMKLSGQVEVTMRAEPLFVPAEIGVGGDRRTLGLGISRVSVVDGPDGQGAPSRA